MFKKKKCANCNSKIETDFDFCPSCGRKLKQNSDEDFGLLGKNDLFEKPFQESNYFGDFTGGIISKMLKGTMKMIAKEMEKDLKNSQNPNMRSNFRLIVNGREIPMNKMQENKMLMKKQKQIRPEISLPQFNSEQQKEFSELKNISPKTEIRRLSDRLIYEIKIPEVNSIKDVSIIKLQNTLEVKAISENFSYFKSIQINFPILEIYFEKEILTLEFDTNQQNI